MTPLRLALTVLTLLIAAAQAVPLGVFAHGALTEDGQMRIALAMAFLLGAPFVLLTIPALVLVRCGRPAWGAGLAGASLIASAILWRGA